MNCILFIGRTKLRIIPSGGKCFDKILKKTDFHHSVSFLALILYSNYLQMSFNQTKLYSIVYNKCPRCHEGNFFEKNNPYNLKQFARMNKSCPACKEDFERETGFYYGAMYASYGLTVAFGVGLFLLMCVLMNLDTMMYLITFAILQVLLMPLFYRIARLSWINLFVKYKDLTPGPSPLERGESNQ